MHRRLKTLLPDATGQSQWVVAVNVDIRGFSARMSANPSETALYLKKVYARILDGYFTNLSFFKPTGDGLLVVIPFEEPSVTSVSERALTDALNLVNAFPDLITDEPLITFPHPENVGIGVSLGSVARLTAKRTTLDYTGRPLNVASRLMDLARPTGVVVDAAVPITDSTIAEQFVSDEVYLKGVAEKTPLRIVFTPNKTEIPDSYRSPISSDAWHVEKESITFVEVKKRAGTFRHGLQRVPTNRHRLEVVVRYPDYKNGRAVRGIERRRELAAPTDYEYVLENGGKRAVLKVDYDRLIRTFSAIKMPGGTNINIEIGYPVEKPVSPPSTVDLSALLASIATK